jgi:hypothetical protein
MRTTTRFALALLVWLLPGMAAADSPIQVAIWHPIQYVEDDESIGRFRFCLLYGVNKDVTGIDVGPLAVRTTGNQIGLQIAMYAEVDGNLSGWQGGGVARVGGILRGVQHGFLFNEASDMRGIQISLINRAERLDGVQIGLLNFNDAGPLKFSPFLNFSF